MKNFKKGFTLVEMLIVVVIIGILSVALLPKLQGAQGSARDTARKADLSQLSTALVNYINNRGEMPYPKNETKKMIPVASIAQDLKDVGGLSQVPSDPNKVNEFVGVNNVSITWGQYGFSKMKKSSIADGWFLLMARTETEGGSNWVLSTETNNLTGNIAENADLDSIKPCTKIVKAETAKNYNGDCTYKDKSQLRYIVIY